MQQTKKKISGYLHKALPFILVALIAFTFGAKFDEWRPNFGSPNGSELPAQLDYSSIDELYKQLRANFDQTGELTEQQLLDGMKKGLVEATGDPYTTYMTAEETKEFYESLDGKFSGIGAELGIRDDQLVIIAPLEGFPAEKAGLQAGDVIVEVNGEESVKWSVEQGVSKIRGEKGTQVTLKIGRNGETKEYSITRDDITVPSVEHEVKDGVGHIQITRFAEDTGDLVRKAADDLKKQNVKGVVLDMRGNGGGYLESAVDVAGVWLKDELIVEEREGDKVVKSLRSGKNAPLEGMPTVVLVDGGSASASEIVAGALQDHGAAELVGEKTFGKGSVQQLEPLSSGGELKVTIARWYTPNGKNIDQEGIEPDEVVEISEDDRKKERDTQLEKARNILNK